MPIDPPAGLDRRTLLRRMALGGAVVWAAPAMHSVASAQAAPSCTPGVLNWDTFAIGTAFTNAVVGGVTVSMAITNVTNTTLLPNNGRVLAGPAGGVNQQHLRFEHTPSNGSTANGSRQTVTFTFSVPVTNVTFSFFDIDNLNDAWGDRLVMSPASFTFAAPVGSTVIGAGTDANRFRNNQPDLNYQPTSNGGNMQVTYAGPISSFSFIYRNQTESGGSNQLISISDISFAC